jgi:chromosome segregation ATPase
MLDVVLQLQLHLQRECNMVQEPQESEKPLRYSVALSPSLATLLKEQAEAEGASLSAAIADIVEDYYNRPPVAEYEKLRKLETEAILEREKQIKDLQREAQEHSRLAAAQLQHAEASAASKLQQVKAEAASQDTIIKGLQNELELTKTQMKSLDEKLAIYTGLNNDLKADKEMLKKQVELLTLRLPAPKLGLWARLFGGGRKNK